MRRSMTEAQGRLVISLLVVLLGIETLGQAREPWTAALFVLGALGVVFVLVTVLSAALRARELGPLPNRAPGERH
jgi:hypothetical protein